MATDYTIPKDEYRAMVAERDKLLDGFHAMQQLYEDELKHALAENAKLRELMKDMYDATVSGCYGCLLLEHVKHPSKCDNDKCEYKRIVDRMRELGIEVDA